MYTLHVYLCDAVDSNACAQSQKHPRCQVSSVSRDSPILRRVSHTVGESKENMQSGHSKNGVR